jgi:tetratricopeptide (TPR) repeat protein
MKSRNQLLLMAVYAGAVGLLAVGCSKQAKKAGHLERANRSFSAQQYPAAEIEYRNVLALDRTNIVAIRNLGHIYYDRGDVPKAFAFLQEARRLEPADLEVNSRLGILYLAAGKTNECRTNAIFILKTDPGHEGALQLLVELARSPRELEDLQKKLSDLRGRLPNQASVPLALGTLGLRKGDLKSAEAEFQKALVLNPKSSEAHQGLGHVGFAQKDLKRALLEYQTAADLAPLRSSVRLRYADVKMMSGDADGGRRVLEDLVGKAPDYIPALNQLAELVLAKQQYDECESLIRRVLALDTMNFEALSASVRVKLARKQPEKAVEEAKRLVQVHARSAMAQYQLAVAYLENRDATNAVSSLRQALKLEGRFTPAALLLGEVHLRQGEFPSAISVLAPLAESEAGQSPNERAALLLARAYTAQGNLDPAAALFRKLSSLGSKNPEIPLEYGSILLMQKKLPEARASFERVLELVPDHLGAMEALVELDLAEKKLQPARERVQGLMTRHPQAPEPVFLMARLYAAGGDNAQAEAALKKSIELNPDFTKAYIVLAQFYANANRQQEAQKQLEEGLKRNPQDRGALTLLAILQNQAGSYPEARVTYERLLSFYPDYAPALNNLAFLYAEPLQQPEKGLPLAQRARLKYPDSPVIADTLGWILFLRGDPAAALPILRESVAKLPAEPEIRYHLAMAQFATGDVPGARAALEQAVKLSDQARKTDAGTPEPPYLKEARTNLFFLALDTSKPDAGTRARLEQRLSEKPHDLVAARQLAALYETQGARDKAQTLYASLLKDNPKSAFALVGLARLQDDPAKALEFARKAREVAPADPQVAFELGRLAYRAGDAKWALSLLQESRVKNPDDPAVLYELALALYSMSRIPEAVTTMKEAAQKGLDPARSAEAKQFLALASLFANPAEAERAASQIQDVLGKSPDDPPALMAAAVLYAQKGNAAAARQACTRLVNRHPFFAPALALLARLQSEPGGDLKEAYKNGQKAREILPTDAEVARTLGIVVYRKGDTGDYARAVDLLKESARTRTQDAEIQYYLGLAHQQLKQKNEARQALTRALELKLDPALAENARKALAGLK